MNPQSEQFEKLRQQYLARRDGAARPIADVPTKGNKLHPGSDAPRTSRSSASGWRSRRRRRSLTIYDDPLVEAVKAFQAKRDISPANGIINAKTRRAFNEHTQVSLGTLLANMEEWRWMPEDLGETYVWVNVPEYTVQRRQQGRGRAHRARHRRRARQADADLLEGSADDLLPPALERAGEHQGEGDPAEPGARRRLLPSPRHEARTQRPRDQVEQRQLGQGRHPRVRHLPAVGPRQCARPDEVHVPQQALRLHARHAEQGPVRLDASAPSATAACA